MIGDQAGRVAGNLDHPRAGRLAGVGWPPGSGSSGMTRGTEFRRRPAPASRRGCPAAARSRRLAARLGRAIRLTSRSGRQAIARSDP